MSVTSDLFHRVREASRDLILLSEQQINDALHAVADKLSASHVHLLEENTKDTDRMATEDPKYDRLQLSAARLEDIAGDLRNVAGLSYPIGTVLETRALDNGLMMEKVSVPLGVVGIIYESRPNVTFDVFALCMKSGNACLLKGGSDAAYSNRAIVALIREVLVAQDINPDIIGLLPADRAATHELLHAVGFVDIIIPRGSQNLINYVRDNAKVPVIETGAGIVHTYFDASGDLEKGKAIVTNAKTRRVSVCNALDCLIVHASRVGDLPALLEDLPTHHVEVFADAAAYASLRGHYPDELLKAAEPTHFGTEFLDYKMSVVTVEDLGSALEHIHRYSSKHSEAVVAEDGDVIEQFLKQVDAAAVYANASTAFTDGAQFGLGAEIGISTQKLHARGPMALREMTSYKWLVRGDGTVRG